MVDIFNLQVLLQGKVRANKKEMEKEGEMRQRIFRLVEFGTKPVLVKESSGEKDRL